MAEACEHCGSSPVPHRLKRITIHIEEALAPLSSAMRALLQRKNARFDALQSSLFACIFEFMALTKLGVMLEKPDEQDFKYVTHVLFEAAGPRGIYLRQFRPLGLLLHTFIAQKGNETLVFERLPVPHGRGRGVHFIDDKAQLRAELAARGFPIAHGGVARTEEAGLTLFHTLPKPVIVKPHKGSGTRHTTLHITEEKDFLAAFRIAKQVSPRVVIEEELEGDVYRPTVVDGKLVATIARMQPSVMGDGTSSIEELIAEENTRAKRAGPVFSKIPLSDAVRKELARQGYTLASIPPAGARVLLHQKINWSVGGTTKDVTALVHQDNRALFERVARALDAPIVGIDFIIGDISRSWKEQKRCGIIECNSMPFIDTHHMPFEGAPQDVAGALWDAAFKKSAQ